MVRKQQEKKPQMSAERNNAFDLLLKAGKNHGINVVNLEDEGGYTNFIQTGVSGLDEVLCYGKGLPRGVMCEFYGHEAGGKSYLAQKICVNAQRQYPNLAVVYVDLESSLEPQRLKDIGVNLNKEHFVLVEQNMDIEELFVYLIDVLPSLKDKVSVLVMDSVAAMIVTGESNQQGQLAKILSDKVKKIQALAMQSGVTLIFINQLRDDIQTSMKTGRKATYTPGGRAIKFFSHLRFNISKTYKGEIKRDGQTIGHKANLEIIKNKVGIPNLTFSFPIYYIKAPVEDRLFFIGRSLNIKDTSKKIISVNKEMFKFDDHSISGEIAFKKAMFQDDFIMDLYNEVCRSGDPEDISVEEIDERKKTWEKDYIGLDDSVTSSVKSDFIINSEEDDIFTVPDLDDADLI